MARKLFAKIALAALGCVAVNTASGCQAPKPAAPERTPTAAESKAMEDGTIKMIQNNPNLTEDQKKAQIDKMKAGEQQAPAP